MTPKKPTLASLSRELKKLREELPSIIAHQLIKMQANKRTIEQTWHVANPASIPSGQKIYDTIKFPTLGLELMKADLPGGRVDKKIADEKIAKLGGGWRLPTEQELLDMVDSMPGEYREDRNEAFIDLTDMLGEYRTSTAWSKETFVLRKFIKKGEAMFRGLDNRGYVRPVRDIVTDRQCTGLTGYQIDSLV